VLGAIRAAMAAVDGSSHLAGRVVGVVGLGKVGAQLARWLVACGATVVGYDPRPIVVEGIERAGSVRELLERELDVLAPCALGGMIDEAMAATLRCRVICGAANNPLASEAAAATLAARGVLYVPDFIANCGGLVRADAERRGADSAEVACKIDEAEERTRAILVEARESGQTPVGVAERHAWERIESARRGVAAVVA
jgi:glutamate dehydrogenase/leucine dehydrogenase